MRQFKLEQVVIIVVITAAWVTPHNLYYQWIRRCEGGERGGFYFHFITIAHKKSPLLESIKHWNSILSSPAPLIRSVLYRLRSLSELTILTWKKISNKDICDPIKQLGPHSPGAPPGIYCYGNDVICKLTSSFALRRLFQRYHWPGEFLCSFEFQTFYGLPVVSVHVKD